MDTKTTTTKACSKCLKAKPLDEFGFDKKFKDGRSSRCKQCNRDAARAYRNSNLEEVRRKDRERSQVQPIEEKRAKHKKWRDANREHVRTNGRETMRRLYGKNPEKFREKSREYAKNNPEVVKRLNQARDPEALRSYSKKYRIDNPDKVKKLLDEYRAKPENKARAKKRKADEIKNLSDSYVAKVLFKDGYRKEEIPKELLEAKRLQLQIKRYLEGNN